MDDKEPLWYERLHNGPFRQDPQPKTTQLHEIIKEVSRTRRPSRPKSLISIVGILALCAIVLSVVIPLRKSNHQNPVMSGSQKIYEGIETNDLPRIPNYALISSYRGSSNNWAAEYVIYNNKQGDESKEVFYLKYLGDKPNPVGEIKIAYEINDGIAGNGSATFVDEPERGIYYLGSFSDDSSVLNDVNIIKLQIIWNSNQKSDYLELKFSK